MLHTPEQPQVHTSSFKILLWKWWRGIDQHLIIALAILIGFSMILVTTASAAVATRIGLPEDYFSSRHLINVVLSILVMVTFSGLEISWLRRIAIMGFAFNIIMLILVKIYGVEVKGAKRWLNILGFSYQPSEFIKPFFAVVTGWIFSIFKSRLTSFNLNLIIYGIVAVLLIIQPDLGMLITVTGIWGIQLFIAGLPFIWIILAVIALIVGLFAAYSFLPHVADRINSFLNPGDHENYQVTKSLLAFEEGGMFGRGPGEGVVKQVLPDSHTDFIFAVAGEEFGAAVCILISLIFCYIVVRGILNLSKENNNFILFASAGILGQIGLQSAFNMGVSLNLLPTKGMTLPFISYGGSSTLSISIAMGMLLAFSKVSSTTYQYQFSRIKL